MAKQAQISRNELKKSLVLISSIVALAILSSLLLITQYWYIFPIILACLLFAVGYFTASKNLYQCPSCNKAFGITALQDFFSLHGLTKGSNGQLFEWKLLKCPECRNREKCYRVSKLVT